MCERNSKNQTLEEFLALYNANKYPRPSVAMDSVALTFLKTGSVYCFAVLLIRRGNHPFINRWAFPGGFLNPDEDFETGLKRELHEETGIFAGSILQLGAYGAPLRDPRTRVISIAYIVPLTPGVAAACCAADDAADANLFTIEYNADLKRLDLTDPLKKEMIYEPVEIDSSGYLSHARFVEPVGHNPKDRLAGDHGMILIDALIRLKSFPPNLIDDIFGRGAADELASFAFDI